MFSLTQLRVSFFLFMVLVVLGPTPLLQAESDVKEKQFFTLADGTDVRTFGGFETMRLLFRKRGVGTSFRSSQEKQYCQLKKNPNLQWCLTDLESGEIISASPNSDEVFFGASVSKIFVAAALLDKQAGELSKEQFLYMVRMIVRSDNYSWRELQRQVGESKSDDSGRQAVQAFSDKMGYVNIRPFQGWMTLPNGNRVHGNELNSQAVDRFLYDTYHNRYAGAEILWKIMHATRTGSNKINKYIPESIYVAGKTGTYHGANESKETVKLPTIKARNHAACFVIKGKHYSLTILSNTGRDEDVAIVSGGLIREYLGIDNSVQCSK